MSVDLDAALLFHMSNGGPKSVTTVLKRGVRVEMLKTSQHQKAFELLVQQATDHQTTPTPHDLKTLFGNVVEPTSVHLSWVVSHLHRRREFNELAALSDSVRKALEENDPVLGREILLEAYKSLKNDPSQAVETTNLFSLGPEVKAQYEQSESGELGVPLPWPSLNDMMQGLYPGTNSWFLARPSTGKTWILLVIILYVWLHGQAKLAEGKKPINILIVSPEMLKAQLAERVFTMIAKVGYGDVVGGTLGVYGKQSFYETIDAHANKVGIHILDASDGLTPERIALAIEETGADVVAIDSVYKIKWAPKAKDRFENMYVGVDIVSGWSKREWSDGRKISCIAASQLNREADKKGGKNASSVALSDNLYWEADNMFLMEQDEDMKADKRLRLLTEKCRRQAKFAKTVLMEWDMTTMTFDEVPEVKKSAKFKDHIPKWGGKDGDAF